MRTTELSMPELALIAGTRAALGAGVALLLSDRLTPERRRAVGWTLFLVGAASTIPLAFEVFGRGGTTGGFRAGADRSRRADVIDRAV
jgi:hypothetical protein